MKKLILVYFITSRQKEYLLLKLSLLSINGWETIHVTLPKYRGILIDENINREEKINLGQYKVYKSLGIMFKAKKLLEFKSLLGLYYSFIHTY